MDGVLNRAVGTNASAFTSKGTPLFKVKSSYSKYVVVTYSGTAAVPGPTSFKNTWVLKFASTGSQTMGTDSSSSGVKSLTLNADSVNTAPQGSAISGLTAKDFVLEAANAAAVTSANLSANDELFYATNGGTQITAASTFYTAPTPNTTDHKTGANPVASAKLQLNGHDRFSEREGRYFNLVQPYQHHTNVPPTGINVYSFGLKPEEHQPSGTCNMSRIDNATLALTVTKETFNYNNKTANVKVYATNYNVLRIMSGMGGLAYSN